MPTPITDKNIHFADPETTVIDGDGGKALRNALIQKQVLTFAELVEDVAVVRPQEISIDDQGRVIIVNEAFQKALQLKIEEGKDKRTGPVVCVNLNCICL